MKLAKKSKKFGEVDITAFADIAFLLIIFFVLTTTLMKPVGAPITIPSGTSDPDRKPDKEPPTINLSPNEILFKEEAVTFDELRAKLIEMKLANLPEAERIIVLDSAPDVAFQRYFRVVTSISKAGGVLALLEQGKEEEKQE